jgi:hypothetical protein
MGLGQGIAEMVDAVRERVEVSWHHETWHVTAGSFESALDYVNERFDDPVVLSRHDRGQRWPRVTLDVTTDVSRAADAPPLSELAELPHPAVPEPVQPSEAADGVGAPEQRQRRTPSIEYVGSDPFAESDMPADLEAIFASQDEWVGASRR